MKLSEFEALTGKKVTAEQYEYIERIYLAAPNVDKKQFCYEWRKAHLDELETVVDMAEANHKQYAALEEWKRTAEEAQVEACQLKGDLGKASAVVEQLSGELAQANDKCDRLALALLRAGMDKEVCEITSQANMIALKCIHRIELTAEDRRYIAETMKKK